MSSLKTKKVPKKPQQEDPDSVLVFKTKTGKSIHINKVLKTKDLWKLKKGKTELTIISHNGVKKIADLAGISTNVEYTVLTQPKYDNNYEFLIQAKIIDHKGRITTELGEANRGNLGHRGKQNPANMAQKRGYDRAVMRHLGIIGILSEDELPDDEPELMESLTEDEQKAIVEVLNPILLAKDKNDLLKVNKTMAKEKVKFNEKQLDFLRKMWRKKAGELTKTF